MNDLLYVCSPYRGDTKRNKEYARKLTRAAINNGFVPVAEMTLAALKGKVMLYEQDGKIYLVDSREETTGGQDNE